MNIEEIIYKNHCGITRALKDQLHDEVELNVIQRADKKMDRTLRDFTLLHAVIENTLPR